MIEYWNENWPIMLDDVRQHATMVLSSLVIALVIAVIIILLFLRREKWLNSLIYFFSLLYSIPSFAFCLTLTNFWVRDEDGNYCFNDLL